MSFSKYHSVDIERLSKLFRKTSLSSWSLKHIEKIGSSNTELLLEGKRISRWDKPVVLVVDYQTAGRGRRGRKWISMPKHSLLCSIGITLPLAPHALTGLSLAISVAISFALEKFLSVNDRLVKNSGNKSSQELFLDRLRLKWPNDILLDSRKLGGVLVEIAKTNLIPENQVDGVKNILANTVSEKPYTNIVIGFGINLIRPDASVSFHGRSLNEQVQELDQAKMVESDSPVALDAAYLEEIICEEMDFQTDLLSYILQSVNEVLEQFKEKGFSCVKDSWWRRHAYRDQDVLIYEHGKLSLRGKVIGINEKGCLLVEVEGRTVVVMNGDLDANVDLSLRKARL